jgi:hypothetical protein
MIALSETDKYILFLFIQIQFFLFVTFAFFFIIIIFFVDETRIANDYSICTQY